mgnify:CR=1 FL=1
MTLEIILKKSESGKKMLAYEFDIQCNETYRHTEIQKGLSLALSGIHNGFIARVSSDGGQHFINSNEITDSTMFIIDYARMGKSIRAAIIIMDAHQGKKIFIVPGDQLQPHKALEPSELIDYWDEEIKKGGNGLLGESLAHEVITITGLSDVVVKYQD